MFKNKQQERLRKSFDENSQEEEQQQSSSEEQADKKKNKKIIVPRFVKNKIEDTITEQIILNVSRTRYEVIEEVCEELGWIIQRSKKSQKWDIMWIDSFIEPHELFKLNQHQKISHFPAIWVITKKDQLGRGLLKMSRYFPQEYDFFPPTWALPSDYSDFVLYQQGLEKENKKQFYIFKPQSGCQGKGIHLSDKIEQFQSKSGIAQVYINNPYLIEGLKFDLRIYVLIAGCDPLRIYIYEEGLGRFATQNYKKAKKKNIKDTFIHLTNYAINKNNKKFIFNQSQGSMNQGHKRSITAVYKYLTEQGVDIDQLKAQIDDIIIKTLIIGQPMMTHMYSLSQPDNFRNDICFHILGFDVLITEDLKPVLLEVNHTPSFATDTPLDKFIKKNLIKDTLNLLNVNVQNKKQIIEQKQQNIQLRSQRKRVKLSQNQKIQLKKKYQLQRDQYEKNHLGGYRKIFPNHNPKYSEMQSISKKLFDEHYGFKKKTGSIKNISLIRTTSLENSNQLEKYTKVQSTQLSPTIKPRHRFKPDISPIVQKSFIKFPTLDVRKTKASIEMFPIICQATKSFNKAHKVKAILDKQEDMDKKDSHGQFLVPKNLQLGEYCPPQKQRIKILQQSILELPKTNNFSIRKKIEGENLLKSLIFRKINSFSKQ